MQKIFVVLGAMSVLFATQSAVAQSASQSKVEPLNLSFLQPPYLRYQSGNRVFGAFNGNDATKCSAFAANEYITTKDDQGNVLRSGFMADDRAAIKVGEKEITVGVLTNGILDTINLVMNKLVKHGDSDISGRHICVGFHDFGVENASSYMAGYIAVDPLLIVKFHNMPGKSMSSEPAAILHEFAHQLQYWIGDPFANDVNDASVGTERRSELAADCAATSMLRFFWDGLSEDTWKTQEDGIIRAIISVGDTHFDRQSHHGTSVERGLVARAGIKIIKRYRAENKTLWRFTSSRMLEACNNFILKMDDKYGTNWPVPDESIDSLLD